MLLWTLQTAEILHDIYIVKLRCKLPIRVFPFAPSSHFGAAHSHRVFATRVFTNSPLFFVFLLSLLSEIALIFHSTAFKTQNPIRQFLPLECYSNQKNLFCGNYFYHTMCISTISIKLSTLLTAGGLFQTEKSYRGKTVKCYTRNFQTFYQIICPCLVFAFFISYDEPSWTLHSKLRRLFVFFRAFWMCMSIVDWNKCSSIFLPLPQSALLLVILASSSILTCHSQIKLTPCLSLVIFISETSVVFVISFLFLQLQRLPIHSSPANLIIVIHSTMAFCKLTWTKYSAYKILWLVSLQIHQNLNTLHQYSKNYIGFPSNNASITNCVFLQHIKRFKFSNLPIFTIVFLFLLTLCLQDHLIHRFCPSHMSEHLWVKGPFLSLLQDSGTPSHQTPVTRYLFLHSAQNSKPIFSS